MCARNESQQDFRRAPVYGRQISAFKKANEYMSRHRGRTGLEGPGWYYDLKNTPGAFDKVISPRVGVVMVRAGRGPAGKRHLDYMISPPLEITTAHEHLQSQGGS
ncbi:hypothetical protein EVAR_60052_1 [Eumeta japonica]|uniref:Uncharacterized protein n=1 Tax=Eumeta variegata TaxID=151549 RepID=A0A4C1YY58_EUMVA|nr:hypothetical protein EVAR_60052_1 [Eumeta japonica]